MGKKLILVISFFIYAVSSVYAWDDKLTHRNLTETAINKSIVNDYLKKYLGIPQGIKAIYRGKRINRLLQDGSENEDIPFRAYNHFWNPIHNEGLDDEGWIFENIFWLNIPIYWHFTGLPNRDWAMGEAEDGTRLDDCGPGDHSSNKECNDYSWGRARTSYYEALIGLSEYERDQKFIEFYEKLGRVLHLLQDVGVPAHSRNDLFGHFDFTEFSFSSPLKWGGNLFEFWVKNKLREDGGYISNLAQNPIIPEFTRQEDYWDKGVYTGADPEITMPINGVEQSGLAEYSNANFLSKCAMFNEDLPFGDRHYFPYPKTSSISNMPPETVIAEDGEFDEVLHLKKDKHGETVDPLVQARYFCEGLYFRLGDISNYYRLAYHLDDECHKSYAEKLLPKTVAYSAGLIDYFFRGNIELSLPEDGFYGLTSDPPTGFTSIKIMAKNTTNNEEEMTNGLIELVVKYRFSVGDPFTNEYSDTSWEFFYIVVPEQNGVTAIPRDEPVELSFDLSGENAIPLWATDVYLQVVYNGQLGNEVDAIAVGYKDISEPTPIDLYNNMDKICFNGIWENAGDPALITYVDNPANGGNDNGIADEWDVYSHNLVNIYYRFFPLGETAQWPSPSTGEYHFYIERLNAGIFNRSMYVLTDYDMNYTYITSVEGLSGDPWFHNDIGAVRAYNAIKNQIEWMEEGYYARYIPAFEVFRGIEKWGGATIINKPYPDPDDLYACPYGELE